MSDASQPATVPIEILIAEDSPTQAQQLAHIIQAHGYRVLIAKNGKEAVAAIATRKPTVVISDIVMPEMDGYELCRRIKTDEHFQDIPVILVTALSDPLDVLAGMECGADNFIVKPYDEQYLLSRIEYIISNRELRRRDTLDMGVEIVLGDRKYFITSARRQILDLLLSTYDTAVHRNRQLLHTQDELRALNASLGEQVRQRTAALEAERAKTEQTNRELECTNKEIGDFYHTVSHELKTPLTSLREFLSILLDGLAGSVTDEQRLYLELGRESCDQMRFCLNDLLDVTRLDGKKLVFDLRPVSIGDLVARTLASMAASAEAKGIRLGHTIACKSLEISADEHRITQVLTNLLSNAVKFTPAGGQIHVTVKEDVCNPDFVLVAVSDTGKGMAKEHLPRIFERLYQVKAADSSSEGGLGLGLFIAREIVRLHGGNIWVESAPEKGSTFSFVLPKRQRQRSTTVLVIDDDDDVVEFGRRALEKAGFTVLTASDGAQALESMRRVVPDLVVLDLRLPTMNGPTVLREIRKGWGDLPVVIYTGYPDSDLLTEAMLYSPITLLAKPCSDNRFVNTVRDLLWRREHPISTEGHRDLQPMVPTIAGGSAGSSPVASVEDSGEQD